MPARTVNIPTDAITGSRSRKRQLESGFDRGGRALAFIPVVEFILSNPQSGHGRRDNVPVAHGAGLAIPEGSRRIPVRHHARPDG